MEHASAELGFMFEGGSDDDDEGEEDDEDEDEEEEESESEKGIARCLKMLTGQI